MKRKIAAAISVLMLVCGVSPSFASSPNIETTSLSVNGDDISIASKDGVLSTLAPERSADAEVSSNSDYSLKTGEVTKNSFQVLITMNNADAPNRYDFELEGVSSIVRVDLDGGFVYRAVDDKGKTLAWLAAPWARDANGISLPTHFEVAAGHLSQIIDTLGNPDVTFPVTADPYLWIDLIASVTYSVDSYHKTRNYKIAVTPWLGAQYVLGGALWAYSAGVMIAQTYGWQEVLDKYEAKYGINMRTFIESTPTYKAQWDCHALGAPAIFMNSFSDTSSTWDLEGKRPSTYNLSTWINTGCNW